MLAILVSQKHEQYPVSTALGSLMLSLIDSATFMNTAYAWIQDFKTLRLLLKPLLPSSKLTKYFFKELSQSLKNHSVSLEERQSTPAVLANLAEA